MVAGIKGVAKYKTLLQRASRVTMRKEWDDITLAEKDYIKSGVDRMLNNDYSRGGYSGKYKRYILNGGKIPNLHN